MAITMTPAIELYPALADIPDIAQILKKSTRMTLPAGASLFQEGDLCHGFPLLLSGRVRVFKQAENGREIQLYRIHAGESCIVTTSCLIHHTPYHARAVTECETELCLLPNSSFQLGLEQPGFRHHILALFSSRIIDLMERVEEVAFHKLDARLANQLLGHGTDVRTTHIQLANELGSVREIVSRLLKTFEGQGYIRLGREHIEILDARALRHIADSVK
jgi:CRP/FNR family transcriptional regulator